MGKIKDRIYYNLVRKNPDVQYEYERYVMENIKEHYENHFKHWKILIKLKWHYQVKKRKEHLLYFDEIVKQNTIQDKTEETKQKNIIGKDVKDKQQNTTTKDVSTNPKKVEKILYYENDYTRESVNRFVASLVDYDIISFDIFDTLIYRKVEKPNDIFTIMSAEMDINDFVDIRKKAEDFARNRKEKKEGTSVLTY